MQNWNKYSEGQEHETVNFSGQEDKGQGQGHRKTKVKVTGGQRSRSQEDKCQGQGHRGQGQVTGGQRSRSQEDKGKGHRRVRLDFETRQRHHSGLPGVEQIF